MSITSLSPASRLLPTALGPVEYAERGSGIPLIVLHGTSGGYDQGLLLADVLGEDSGVRVIALSRPGYLRTPLSAAPGPLAQGALVHAVLDELGIERAAVAGVSAGGMAALSAAARDPERIGALVLIEALVRRQNIRGSALVDLLLTRRGIARAAVSAPVQLAMTRCVEPAADGWDPRRHVRRMTAATFPYRPRMAGSASDVEYAQSFIAPPARDLTLPTLILHGDRDRVVPAAAARELSELLPDARYREISGADHLGTVPSHTVRREIPAFLRERFPHA